MGTGSYTCVKVVSWRHCWTVMMR